jgi:hypothetical protein
LDLAWILGLDFFSAKPQRPQRGAKEELGGGDLSLELKV